MITLPLRYLRLILTAVIFMRKAKAFNANMFSHSGIGHHEDVVIHTDLTLLERYIQEVIKELQHAKQKNFIISAVPPAE